MRNIKVTLVYSDLEEVPFRISQIVNAASVHIDSTPCYPGDLLDEHEVNELLGKGNVEVTVLAAKLVADHNLCGQGGQDECGGCQQTQKVANTPPRGAKGRFLPKVAVAEFDYWKAGRGTHTRRLVVDIDKSTTEYLRGLDLDRKAYRTFRFSSIVNGPTIKKVYFDPLTQEVRE